MPGGYSLMRTWFGRLWGLSEKRLLESSGERGSDSRRLTTGDSSQKGSGAWRSLLLTRSEGQVWRRRCVSCFQRGLGASAICRMQQHLGQPHCNTTEV